MNCLATLVFASLFPHGVNLAAVDIFSEAIAKGLPESDYVLLTEIPRGRQAAMKLAINSFPGVYARILPDGNIVVSKIKTK